MCVCVCGRGAGSGGGGAGVRGVGGWRGGGRKKDVVSCNIICVTEFYPECLFIKSL